MDSRIFVPLHDSRVRDSKRRHKRRTRRSKGRRKRKTEGARDDTEGETEGATESSKDLCLIQHKLMSYADAIDVYDWS